jgi:hypothetical protein
MGNQELNSFGGSDPYWTPFGILAIQDGREKYLHAFLRTSTFQMNCLIRHLSLEEVSSIIRSLGQDSI